MTRRQSKTLRRILAAAVLYALLFFLPAEDALPGGLWLRAALYLVPYAIGLGCAVESPAQYSRRTGV